MLTGLLHYYQTMKNQKKHPLHKQSPSMKPTTTQWEALSKRFQPVHQQEELAGVMLLRSSRTNGSSLCSCQGLNSKRNKLDQNSLLIFHHFSVLARCRLLSYITIYHIFACSHISYRFLSSLSAEVLSLEMKYDFFRNGGEGTWQKQRQ